jgi:hypothetical protein
MNDRHRGVWLALLIFPSQLVHMILSLRLPGARRLSTLGVSDVVAISKMLTIDALSGQFLRLCILLQRIMIECCNICNI